MGAATAALIWANSPWAHSYHAFWHIELSVGLGDHSLAMPLEHWVNDGLMTVFFLLVGLEIKRELLFGELASFRQAALPLVAAIGGMIAPASIYAAFNARGGGAPGWGIPMATDIAFAIGVLALVGRAVPTSVKAFLLAVAIVDDLGAVLVIALFYTSKISVPALGATGLLFLGLTMLNLLRVHRPFPYLVLGTGLWIAILLSGLHATLAGVLLAVTIPAIRQFEELPYVEHVRRMLDEFERDVTAVPDKITESQSHAIKAMEEVSQAVQTPLALLEHALLKPVSFVIVPVFALANAGVNLGDASAVQPTDPVLWGVLLGLLVGKPVGVLLGSWLAIKGRFAAFPEGAKWHHLAGVSVLCGIGFTMSLFVGNLAFSDDEKRLVATKVAILLASSASALAGALLLKVGQRLMKEPSAQ